MSDLIVNVRQISQYTAQTQAQASDNLLIQRGGLGGAFTGPTGQIGIGLPLPGDASSTGIIGSNLLMPLGCTFGWNWYRTATGTSYLAAGYALQECFSGSGLTINAAPSGSPGQPVTAWSQILNLALNGTLTIPGTLTAAPATATSQMATLGQVNAAVAAAVTSFNGRTGAVSLTLADVTGVGGAPTNSPTFTGVPAALTAAANSNSAQLATTMYVDRAVSTLQANSVTSFNTRQGAVTLTLTDVTGVGGAPAANPIFTGVPITPTAAPGTNTQQIASTQFVTNAVTTLQTNSVNSFNGRTGVVGLTTNDITNAGGAPIASPAFSGLPNAPTAAPGTSTSQLATTAFVQAAITASVGGVASFNTRTGAVTLTAGDLTGAGGALLNSPGFTGVPTAPTAPNNTNTTQLATTAYVQNEIASISAGVTSFNTRSGNVVLSLADVTSAGGAPIASPNLSGIPTAPTAAPGTNTTQIATCAFVAASAAAGVTSFNSRTGAITLTNNDITAAGGLSNPNPNLLGTPTAPTSFHNTSTTQIATTAFVTSAIGGLGTNTVSAPPPPATPNAGAGWFNLNDQQLYIWNGSTWVIAVNPPIPNLAGYAPINSPTFTGTVTIPSGASIAGYLTTATAATTYAPLASPTFTGNPTGVTQPPGDNDTSLATTQFVQTALVPAFNDTGRNLLHNALFNVQQRGAGPWSGQVYTADRWRVLTANDTASFQAIAFALGGAAGINDEAAKFYMYCSITGSATAGSFTAFTQSMEGVTRTAGKTITVSFYCGVGTGTANLAVDIVQQFGTGGSPSTAVTIAPQSTVVTTTWTRYSFTFSVPSIAGKTIGTNNDDLVSVRWWLSNTNGYGTVTRQTNNFAFWGMQCEIGSVMTPLEKLDPVLQYQQCQRFYQVLALYWAGYVTAGNGYGTSTPCIVSMRAGPTLSLSANNSTNFGAVTLGNLYNISAQATATASTTAFGAIQVAAALSADL